MLYNSTQTSVIVYKYHKQTTVQYFGGEECSRSTIILFTKEKSVEAGQSYLQRKKIRNVN